MNENLLIHLAFESNLDFLLSKLVWKTTWINGWCTQVPNITCGKAKGRKKAVTVFWDYVAFISGALLAKDSLERMAMKRTKKIKEMRPKVSSHLNVGIAETSITDADAQRTLNHKMAKRQKQPIHQLRIRPLPRLSRAGLSKCRLTISTIIRFGHPTRRNEYEIPAIRNEQRLELKTLSACFLPSDQITLELSALSMQHGVFIIFT